MEKRSPQFPQFFLGSNKTKKTEEIVVNVSPSIFGFFLIGHYIFERVMCVVHDFLYSKYLWRNVHRKMGGF